jgi:hypothetical protein
MILFFWKHFKHLENGTGDLVLIVSAASLSLNPGDEIENAYLYWAGSGFGDFVK